MTAVEGAHPTAPRSRFGRLYDRLFFGICGTIPVRPWHFQWLAVADLYRDLKQVLPRASGTLLDVGCGDKPYARWAPNVTRYVGIDVYAGPQVDMVIQPFERWPVADVSCDSVLCTQVLEHTVDLDHVISEIDRVLKPGGLLIASAPFCYNEHGTPHDYRRLSAFGLPLLFKSYDILETRREGGVGSTLGVMVLNWFDAVLDRTRIGRATKLLLLPLWVLVSALWNLLWWTVDRLDPTGIFYGNVMILARKKA